MEIMKKTHNKSFIIRAEIGSPFERRLTSSSKPYITTSDGDIDVVILQCQVITSATSCQMIAEVVQKKDFEEKGK